MGLHREKLKDAIVYISAHPEVRSLGLTKLYKLLYFADVAHLREHGESITGSEYIKYQHGPVPSRGEKLLKQLRKDERVHVETVPFGSVEMMSIRPAGARKWDSLLEPEVETLDLVCQQLGRETALSLSEKSHAEPAWIASAMLEKLSDELMMYGAAEDPDGL